MRKAYFLPQFTLNSLSIVIIDLMTNKSIDETWEGVKYAEVG